MQYFKNSNPLVSIITPVYNSNKFLEKTIKSVISQSYTNWELILINDGSTDGSDLTIKTFEGEDSRIKSIHFQQCSGGPAFPRNEGLKVSEGEFVSFLDSDDLWEPSKLEQQIKLIKTEPNSIVFSGSKIIDENHIFAGHLNRKYFFRVFKKFLSNRRILLLYNPIVLSSSLVKKTEDIKFREDKSLQSIEDWALWIDLTFKGYNLFVMENTLCSLRIHKDSISAKNNKKQYKRGFVLYSKLLLEKKIGYLMFIFLTLLNYLRLIKFRLFGRR